MTTLQTIGKAPQAEQLSFGIALGNLIAHELRHQLALSRTGAGLGHSSSGLGMDGADFSNPNIDFADKNTIRTKLAQLQKAQLDYWWSLL